MLIEIVANVVPALFSPVFWVCAPVVVFTKIKSLIQA